MFIVVLQCLWNKLFFEFSGLELFCDNAQASETLPRAQGKTGYLMIIEG